MALKEYRHKRKFNQTPEPKGKRRARRQGPLRFVVHMHKASRLHFDLRLEIDGVFKSWAVPKGPSLNPHDQRLAVFVEDHPLEYGSFEGIIPRGNYGAGTVMLWDRGTYLERGSKGRADSERKLREGLAAGHLTFVLKGKKLKGEFALVQFKKDPQNKAWLLIKKRDEHANVKREQDFAPLSVKTGRTLEEVAAIAEKFGQIWKPKKTRVAQAATPARLKPAAAARPFAKAKKGFAPMLATPARTRQPGSDWLWEPHFHGLRAISEVNGKHVRLYSKSGLPFERRFSKIVADLSTAGIRAVLDGEIVDKTYHVFDILSLDGRDLRATPLLERKKLLKSAVKSGTHIKLVTATARRGSKKSMVAKNPESVYTAGTSSEWLMVDPTRTRSHAAPQTDEPRLTNRDRIYFPEDGVTKGDVLDYYAQVAPYILPYLKDRPESLSRHPNGIHEPGFYQKNMTGPLPRWFKTVRIYSKSTDRTIDYPVVEDKRGLLYIANLGCIEIHPWLSRTQDLDRPDFVVVDLDPDGNDFRDVMKVALALHEVLNRVGAPNFCKTSGADGLHVGIPTGAKYDYDTAREFALLAARIVHKKFPAITSLERVKGRRRKKIYLDCFQNARGQTLAAPFCIRPRSGAPISMPVKWSELTPDLRPGDFNIKAAPHRLNKFRDPWLGVLGQGLDLATCRGKLERILNKA